MSAQHTPGPLQVADGFEVWDTRGDGAPGIPLVKADLGLNRKWGREIGGSEILANLTLFAAAPDLLEALQTAMQWIKAWDVGFLFDDDWAADEAKIRAAIAKATAA